nr:hypothetical protein Iba_chr14cCG6320 [Ipomoea batatas]
MFLTSSLSVHNPTWYQSAGEGTMPPQQLPAPASHAELLRVRLQRQIRRGLLLRRGVTRSKQDLIFFEFPRSICCFYNSAKIGA